MHDILVVAVLHSLDDLNKDAPVSVNRMKTAHHDARSVKREFLNLLKSFVFNKYRDNASWNFPDSFILSRRETMILG